ncbi:MAG TPA: hypothetical protein VFP09_02920 [Desertimonas sp.]|nr:hypothetical protein [Desertimonas sp.]
MAIKQPNWIAGSLAGNNTTVYWQPMGSVQGTGTFHTAEASAAFKMDVGGTCRNLRVRLGTAPGGSATRTVVLRKNGADQAVTVTLNSGDTDVSDTSNSFSVAAGDTLIVKFTATNTPAASTVALVWELETADNFISHYSIGAASTSLTTNTTYIPMFSAGGESTTAAQGTAVAPIAGTIASYRILLHTAPGAAASGKSRTFVIEKNGVAQDGSGGTPNTTITISETATTGAASFSLTITALDLVRVKATAANTPATSRYAGAHDFTATTSGEVAYSATPNDAPGSSGYEYQYGMGGSPVWTATEARAELPGPITSISLNGLYVTHDAALGAACTHTYTLRKNGAASDQILHFLATETTKGPSGTAAVSLGSSDRFCFEAFVVGTTSSTARPHLAFALGTAPFASTVRVTQAVVETVSLPTPDVRVTQLVVETICPTQTPFLGTLSVTLDALTVAGTGTVTTPTVTGTLAVTLDDLTVAGTGTVTDTVTGTLAVTLDDLTVAATGTVSAAAISGTLAVTLDPLTVVGTGTVTTEATVVDQYALEYVVDLAEVVYLGPGASVCGRDQVMVWIETTSDVIDA